MRLPAFRYTALDPYLAAGQLHTQRLGRGRARSKNYARKSASFWCQQGTVSKASLCLRIAQPALSRQISDLEHELGLMLFDRVGRRLVLTGEGEQLLGDCRSLLGQVGALGERAELLRRGDSGVLKVAATPHMIESVLSTFVSQYAERYPKVEVKFFEAFGPAQLDLLERGEVHVGIRMHTDDIHIGKYPLPPIEVVAAVHPSLQLGRGGMVEIARLAPHPLLLLESGYSNRRTFDAACRLARLEPNILLRAARRTLCWRSPRPDAGGDHSVGHTN
jgi:LysR family transcriptional regulator, nitrogen assimilation regulatory protein